MKRDTILPLLLPLLVFSLSYAQNLTAAELWTVGTPDNSHAEFAVSGKFGDYTAKFPQGAKMKVDCLKVGEEWPFILPGPIDNWAGNKKHSSELNFDYFAPAEGAPQPVAFVLEIKGWSQASAPPKLDIKLNETARTLETRANPRGDQVLDNPTGVRSEGYKIIFPKSAIKQGGNTIKIETAEGSWLVFDAIQFSTADAGVKEISLNPARGVLRDENPEVGLRRIEVDFKGGFIAEKTPISYVAVFPDEIPFTFKEKISFDPDKNPGEAELFVPVPLDNIGQPFELSVTLGEGEKAVTAEATIPGDPKIEVFLLHQTHLDIGYTHTQEDVIKRQVESLHEALKYIEETKDYPAEAQFRFHPEGMWAVEEFMKTATESEKAAFIKAAKERRIPLDAMYAQAMTGMYGEEELFELLLSAVRFGKEHGIEIESAMQTDLPGFTWGLVTALGQSGIKYMSMGPNTGHRVGRVYYWGDKPFYWESASGKEKVLCWLIDSGYSMFHRHRHGQRIAENEIFDIVYGGDWPKSAPEVLKYPYDMMLLRYGIEGDNGRPNRVISDVVKEWNEKFLYPKLVISSNLDAMREFEKRYGDVVPTLKGDYTPHWEDGCISTTEATGLNRRSHERILQVQTLWAMFNAKDYPVKAFDEAYTNMIMYDEHTWGAHNSISEPDSDFVIRQDNYKQNYARKAATRIEELYDSVISPRTADSNLVEVINTTTRDRGDFVLVPWNDTLRKLSKDGGKLFAKDGEKTIPVQESEDGLIFYASYIQPLGTKTFEIINIPNAERKRAVEVDLENLSISNSRITMKLDPKTGAVVSLRRNNLDHEFVKAGDDGNSGLNDYLYILGRDATKNRSRIEGDVKITAVGAKDGSVFAELKVESTAPNCRSLVRVYRVYANNDRIEFRNTMDKEMERRPEGTFFAFPFNIPGGQWYLDEPWSIVRPELDQLPGGNRNFYCLQRYAMLANDDIGVDIIPIEANMMQFSPILFAPAWDRTLKSWREKIAPDGTFYSWVCSNHWETNYKAGQEGKLHFRYIICPYAASTEHGIAQHVARESSRPMIAITVDPKKVDRSLEPGILRLDNNFIAITSAKPARDGSGDMLVRVYNPTDREESVRVLYTEKKEQFLSNPLEEKLSKAPQTLKLAPKETLLIRASDIEK